mgnify:CR=1 FL=1|tara:strand:- start:5893 stop:6969 length:1077 start_codon:yes stop_codon:yes gene_type:complete
MRKILLLLIVLFSTSLNAQIVKKILKYSTVFGSYTESSPLTQTSQYFVTQAGDLVDVTPEQSNDYMVTFGIRKIARMDYENKAEKFYDGTESLSSLNSNIGAIKGLEYLFQYSKGSQQNREFQSQRYFIRYIANYWVAKVELQQNGLINLDYKTADLRLRLPIGKKFSVSAGAAVRTHQPYGYSPIATYLEDLPWWDLAYEYGFQDNYYGIDSDNDGELDSNDWWWSNEEGERIADTDLDFRRNDYEDIVNDYNETELNAIGQLGTLSAVIGADYYHFRDKWWIHSWGNIFPKHKHIFGDEAYSYETFTGKDDWVDFNYGLIFGWNINKSIGIFTEYEKTKFWDKNLVFLKAGINFRL